MTALTDALTEKDLQASIVEAARWFRWHVFHPFDSRRSAAGWPDLSMVHPDYGIVFAELKREGKHPTSEQVRVLAALARWNSQVYVWRPSNLTDVISYLQGTTGAMERLEPTRVTGRPTSA